MSIAKRRLIRWSLILIVLVALAIWLEPTRIVWGWLRGEAFYDGFPTSYWRGVIERDLETEPRVLHAKLFPQGPAAPPTWWDRCQEWFGVRWREASSLRLVVYGEAAEVLRALAEDADEKIAGFAADVMRIRPWRPPTDYWLEVLAKHR